MKFINLNYNFTLIGISFIFISILHQSCVPYRISSYCKRDTIGEKIPNLELRVIDQNLQTFYGNKISRICKNTKAPDSYRHPNYPSDNSYFIENSPNGLISKTTNFWKPHTTKLKRESSKSKNYFRIDDFYIGKTKQFQDSLFTLKPSISLSDFKSKEYKLDNNLVFTISKALCPSFTTKCEIKNYIGEPIRGYENGTVPYLIEDVIDIFEYDFKNNICNNSPIQGYCVLKLLSDSVYNTTSSIASAFSTFTISLLGAPIIKQDRTIEIEIDIFSKENKLLKSYKAKGNSKKYCTMFWGYSFINAGLGNSNGPLSRATNSGALKSALNQIKKKIEIDSKELVKQLLN